MVNIQLHIYIEDGHNSIVCVRVCCEYSLNGAVCADCPQSVLAPLNALQVNPLVHHLIQWAGRREGVEERKRGSQGYLGASCLAHLISLRWFTLFTHLSTV